MSNQVDLEMVVSNPVDDSKPTVEGIHKRFYIDNYSVSVVGPQKSAGTIDFQNLKDSLRHDGIFYHFDKKILLRHQLLPRPSRLSPVNCIVEIMKKEPITTFIPSGSLSM
jgi:hypothetical protein